MEEEQKFGKNKGKINGEKGLISTFNNNLYLCGVFHLRLRVLRALQLHDMPVRQVNIIRISLHLLELWMLKALKSLKWQNICSSLVFNIQCWLKRVAQGQNDSIMTEMKPRSKGCQSFGYCGCARDFQMSFGLLGHLPRSKWYRRLQTMKAQRNKVSDFSKNKCFHSVITASSFMSYINSHFVNWALQTMEVYYLGKKCIIFLGFLQIFIRLEIRKLLPVQLIKIFWSLCWYFLLCTINYTLHRGYYLDFVLNKYLLSISNYCFNCCVQMSWKKLPVYCELRFTPKHLLYFYILECNKLLSLPGLRNLFLLPWLMQALEPESCL